MATLLTIDFTFPKPSPRQSNSSLPEIQLVSLLVVAVKLYHPFDSQPRYSRTLTEFGTLVIDWDVWRNSQTEYATRHTSAGKLGRGNEIHINENDVMAMSGEQLDEYLDWYEKTWIKEEVQVPSSRRLPQQLLDMFPTGRPDGSLPVGLNPEQEAKADQVALNHKLKTVQSSLKLRVIVSEGNEEISEKPVKRIGSFYKRYRNIENLSPQAKAFYEATASSIGISLSSLVLAVFQVERKLEIFRTKEVKDKLLEDEDLLGEEEYLEGDYEIPTIDRDDGTEGEKELSGGNQDLRMDTEDEIVSSSEVEPAVQGTPSETMED